MPPAEAAANPAPAEVQAQEAGTTQIFVGYSFLDMKPANEEAEIDKEKLSGWHTSLTYWLNGRFGIMGEVSAHYGGEFPLPPNAQGLAMFDFDQVQFLVGPRIKMLQRGRLSSSFRAVFGASTGTTFPAVADINDNVAGPILRSADETVFAMDFGVSFDVSVNDTVAIRVFQPNFNITNYGEETQSNFRFSTGVIFSFGG